MSGWLAGCMQLNSVDGKKVYDARDTRRNGYKVFFFGAGEGHFSIALHFAGKKGRKL